MFFPFITGKGFIFRVLIDVAAVAYVVLALSDRKYRPRFSWPLVLYAGLVVWMFIADLFAINAHKAFWSNFERMDGWVTLVHVFAFFVIAGSVLTADKLWRKWWMTFIAASGLVAGYALLQLGGGIEIHQGGARVDATLGNAAYLAAYLLFVIGVIIWHAFTSKGTLRYTLAALALVHTVILFYTATRGAILAAVGASVLGAFLFALESGKKGRKSALVVLAGLVLVIGGFFLVRDSAWVKSDPTLGRISSITLAEGATRFTLWGMAWQGVLERPLVGYGHEGFNYIFNERYTPSLYAQEPWFDRAHNVFIDWLVWGGFPAFFLLIGLIGSAAFALYRSDEPRTERILLVSILAAYSFQALFVFDHLFSYVPLAAVLAIAHAVSSRPIKKLETMPELSQSKLETVVAPAGMVVAIALAWMVNVPNMQAANHLVYGISPLPGGPAQNLEYFKKTVADRSFARQEIAEQLVSFYANISQQENVPQALKDEFRQLAQAAINTEVTQNPNDARLRLQYALFARASGDMEEALRQTEAALALSPYKQSFYLERGQELLALGRVEEARATFHAAYELDTRFNDLAGYAAAADIISGDTAGGKAFLQSVFGTTTVDHQALVRAYFETKNYPDLIAVLRLQMENAGGSVESRIRLISGYALAGRFNEARAEANALLVAHPDQAGQVQAILASFPKGQ